MAMFIEPEDGLEEVISNVYDYVMLFSSDNPDEPIQFISLDQAAGISRLIERCLPPDDHIEIRRRINNRIAQMNLDKEEMIRDSPTAEELEMTRKDHEDELAGIEKLTFDIPEFPVVISGGKSARRGRKKKRKNKSRIRRG